MLEYLFLVFAVLCIGGQFTFQKLYQTKVTQSGVVASFLFSGISAGMATLAFAVVCGFKIPFNWFSFLMAAGGMSSVVLYTVLGIKMMSIGKVAVYTTIIMLGGMLLPFLYGIIFLNEQLSVGKVIGIIVIFISLILSISQDKEKKDKNTLLFSILGVIVFIANGLVGIFNKVHQISENAISTYQFGFWQNIFVFVLLTAIVSITYFAKKDRQEVKLSIKAAFKNWWIIALFTVVCQAGSVFQLLAAKAVDASVMFPIITGGSMVASTIFGWMCFKESIDKKVAISLLLAVVSTVLIAL